MAETDSWASLTRETRDEGDLLLRELTHSESDRGAALLGCSLIEYAARRVIRSCMVALTANEEKAMFFNLGPLSDFEAVIVVGYAFNVFDQQVRDDLTIIRSIRNAFGHSQSILTFEHVRVKEKVSRLVHSKQIVGHEKMNSRAHYVNAIKLLYSKMMFASIRQPLPTVELPASQDK